MRIAITGSTGLVGRAVAPMLTGAGHNVLPIVRRQPGPGEIGWNPSANEFDAAELDGVDGVVHLAGENLAAGRWTRVRKDRIRASRVRGTDLVCRKLAGLAKPPRTLVSASAIGYYGDRGDQVLDEGQPPGTDFLADVVREWEAATRPAIDAGIRVVQLRIGVVLAPDGGALARMLTPFKLGLGGRVGNGRQYWSWISIDDIAGAVYHALTTDSLSGPVNATAPNPVTNRQFTRTLGRVISRPTMFPMPAMLAKIAFGEMAEALLLSSTRVQPTRLLESGYTFQHPELEDALRELLMSRSLN